MGQPKKALFTACILLILAFPATLFGNEHEPHVLKPLGMEGTFVLTVEENLVSLKARQASLKNIVEEIARKMDIEVLGNILDSETISIEFKELSLGKALERLSSNYGYQMNSEEGSQAISKIFVLPKGTGKTTTRPATKKVEHREEPGTSNSDPVLQAEDVRKNPSNKEKPERPKPFKFQFDPSAMLGK